MTTQVWVSVSPSRSMTVTCTASRAQGETGANLQLGEVVFRNLTDDGLQQIADSIELYLIKKNQRERKARAAAQVEPPAAEPPKEPES